MSSTSGMTGTLITEGYRLKLSEVKRALKNKTVKYNKSEVQMLNCKLWFDKCDLQFKYSVDVFDGEHTVYTVPLDEVEVIE